MSTSALEVTERGKDLVSHYHRNSGQPPAAEEEDLSDAVPSGEEDDISDAGPDAYAGPGALSASLFIRLRGAGWFADVCICRLILQYILRFTELKRFAARLQASWFVLFRKCSVKILEMFILFR